MGRSAKVFKKPSKNQKAVSKIAKAASNPLPPPPPPEPAAKDQPETAAGKVKKRRLMRAKVDKKLGKA